MFGQGYQIVQYRKDFFGPNKVEGPRLIMSKKRGQRNNEKNEMFFVHVPFFGAPFDKGAHDAIESHLKAGRRGVDVNREGIFSHNRCLGYA